MLDQRQAFLEYLRFNRNVSAHTARAYESDLTQFISSMAKALGCAPSRVRPADFDQLAVRGFLAELYKRGSSRASAARKLAAIRSFGRYLRREQQIDGDPGALVGTPKLEQKIPAHLEVNEMEQLLTTPDIATPLGRRDRAILELFYASGLRLSELVALDVEDADLNGRLVRVHGKGGRQRIVPFNRSAAKAIRGYLRDRDALQAKRAIAPAAAAAVAACADPNQPAVPQLPWRAAVDAQR